MNSQAITNTSFESNKQDKLQVITPDTLKMWLDNHQVNLIDVREPAEYKGEHIENAISLPLSQFDSRKIPLDKKFVLYCQSSNRSSQAAQKLFTAGFDSVIHLEGGLNLWKQAGLPTKIVKNAPISIMRQVQIVTGSLVLTGTILGVLVSPWFLILSGFIGAGLLFAGISNTCMLAMLLAKLPYNQK